MESDLKTKIRILRETMFAGFHSYHGPETGGRQDAVPGKRATMRQIGPEDEKEDEPAVRKRRLRRRVQRGKGGSDT